jgi:hypothetical protein
MDNVQKVCHFNRLNTCTSILSHFLAFNEESVFERLHRLLKFMVGTLNLVS